VPLSLQDARTSTNTPLLAQRLQEYDEELGRYMPVLMAQAHIYWETGQYSNVIKLLNQSKEFAAEHEVWKLNMAHAYFMIVRSLFAGV
jgi:tetratricopeptide repeat protein 30